MGHLAQQLGVSPALGFHDVFTIEDSDLLAFIPRPVYALIFLCPHKVFLASGRDAEKTTMPVYNGSGVHEPVMWFKQTIGHACGLIALLHAMCNGEARQYIRQGSDLDKLMKSAIPLKPTERAQLLYDSVFLEAAHQASAVKGDSNVPRAEDDNGYHFIAFVKEGGRLWELNGGMMGPLDRGALDESEDALSEKALQMGVREFINAAKAAGIEDVGFSIVAVSPNFD
jgi:ubiquitin carboxyl-terminal hydrolase L3